MYCSIIVQEWRCMLTLKHIYIICYTENINGRQKTAWTFRFVMALPLWIQRHTVQQKYKKIISCFTDCITAACMQLVAPLYLNNTLGWMLCMCAMHKWVTWDRCKVYRKSKIMFSKGSLKQIPFIVPLQQTELKILKKEENETLN